MANYRLPKIDVLTRKEMHKLNRADYREYRAKCLQCARYWLIKSNALQLWMNGAFDKVEDQMLSDYKWAKKFQEREIKQQS
jgi:phosphoribosyl-dephospho-CoA transferase